MFLASIINEILSTVFYFIFFLFIGALPSLLWLVYFLRKDKDREPFDTLFQLFILGGISTLFALILELAYGSIFSQFFKGYSDLENCIFGICFDLDTKSMLYENFYIGIYMLLGISVIEELAKFIFARLKMKKDKYFDLPVDGMIYLIVVALGFAAVENTAFVSGMTNLDSIINLLYLRAITATLLHVIASGVFGYFFSLSLVYYRLKYLMIFIGFLGAVLIHTIFNFLIITESGFYLVIVLGAGLFLLNIFFKHLKKLNFSYESQRRAQS